MMKLNAITLCIVISITLFAQVKRVLLSAGNLVLKPDHYEEQNAPPEWRYYEIWMQIRKQLSDML